MDPTLHSLSQQTPPQRNGKPRNPGLPHTARQLRSHGRRHQTHVQRCALSAGGWDEITLFGEANSDPLKLPKKVATRTRRLHALLGSLLLGKYKFPSKK